jgi:coenzyme F420-reducing hydrogenase delta subunit
MDEEQRLELPGVSADDWRQTPETVRNLVVELVLKVERLEKKLKELEIENERIREKSERTSENSHSPPSLTRRAIQNERKRSQPEKSEGDNPVIRVIAVRSIWSPNVRV